MYSPTTASISAQDKKAIEKIEEAKQIAEQTSVKASKKELKSAIKSIKKTLDNKPVDNFLKRGFSNVGSFFSNAYQKTKKFFSRNTSGGATLKKGRKGKKGRTSKKRTVKGGNLGYSEYNSNDSDINLDKADPKLENDTKMLLE
jgi:tRNA G10  N-methylase Trm11